MYVIAVPLAVCMLLYRRPGPTKVSEYVTSSTHPQITKTHNAHNGILISAEP